MRSLIILWQCSLILTEPIHMQAVVCRTSSYTTCLQHCCRNTDHALSKRPTLTTPHYTYFMSQDKFPSHKTNSHLVLNSMSTNQLSIACTWHAWEFFPHYPWLSCGMHEAYSHLHHQFVVIQREDNHPVKKTVMLCDITEFTCPISSAYSFYNYLCLLISNFL